MVESYTLKDCMLSLHCLGQGPNSAIAQVGAVLFDPDTGRVADPDAGGDAGMLWAPTFGLCVDVASSVRAGMGMDPGGVLFWLRESKEAREAVFPLQGAYEFDEAVCKFVTWYSNVGAERVWSHGAGFHVPIMESAIRLSGMRVPWHHRDVRDTRTAYDFARRLGVPCGMPYWHDKLHLSIYDAAHRALRVAQAYTNVYELHARGAAGEPAPSVGITEREEEARPATTNGDAGNV